MTAALTPKQPKPVAYLVFWAGRFVSPDGGVEADEGLEVAKHGEVGADGLPAFPVFGPEVVDALQQRIEALEAELAAAKKNEQRYQHVINELSAWTLITLCTDYFVTHKRKDTPNTKESADAAIDAAMAAGEKA